MSIKLAVLKSGETIISDAKEVIMEGDDPNDVKAYMFENPHTVTTRSKVLLTEDEKTDEDNNDYSLDVVFSPWIVLTKDKNIMVPLDWVVTIVEPLSSVTQMFIDKTDSTLNINEE